MSNEAYLDYNGDVQGPPDLYEVMESETGNQNPCKPTTVTGKQ